ncbi:hypothetical protein BQ8482_120021 [Mesorhizobium delmotii]|uniref:Uncharacterized protein n=1 Tax=Mesorhizobium delmotii TaxID=1631247 RepID=A0A2P9AFU9_9HYPH|nr:hypothetical protein BQ8482_120021 [Mesorhizobium delmotii]
MNQLLPHVLYSALSQSLDFDGTGPRLVRAEARLALAARNRHLPSHGDVAAKKPKTVYAPI